MEEATTTSTSTMQTQRAIGATMGVTSALTSTWAPQELALHKLPSIISPLPSS